MQYTSVYMSIGKAYYYLMFRDNEGGETFLLSTFYVPGTILYSFTQLLQQLFHMPDTFDSLSHVKCIYYMLLLYFMNYVTSRECRRKQKKHVSYPLESMLSGDAKL